MNGTQTMLTVLLAAVVLIGLGAAAGSVSAAPGPDGVNETDAGPPGDLPEPVPEFVGDVLHSIGEFVSGGIDDLGEVVSGIASGVLSGGGV